MRSKLAAVGLLTVATLGVSACWPGLPAFGEQRLTGPEMAVLFGGGAGETGKCCYVIPECAESPATSCNGRNPCNGEGLSSIAT